MTGPQGEAGREVRIDLAHNKYCNDLVVVTKCRESIKVEVLVVDRNMTCCKCNYDFLVEIHICRLHTKIDSQDPIA